MDGPFDILACDFSYHCTGIAILHYDSETRTVSVKQLYNIPIARNYPLPHGLAKLQDIVIDIIERHPVRFFIREKAVMYHTNDSDRLLKVAGVMDVTLWRLRNTFFYEYPPSTIKKWAAGHGNAKKEQLAKALEKFVGPQKYETDDESDAVGVGVTFLRQEGYLDDPFND